MRNEFLARRAIPIGNRNTVIRIRLRRRTTAGSNGHRLGASTVSAPPDSLPNRADRPSRRTANQEDCCSEESPLQEMQEDVRNKQQAASSSTGGAFTDPNRWA